MFSQRLKQLRKQCGITQTDFAQSFNIANGTVGNWESGKREPDITMLIKIASFFMVTVDYLIGNSNEQNPSYSSSLLLSPVEQGIINRYRTFNQEGQELVVDYIDTLDKSGKYIKSNSMGMEQEKA